MSAAVFLLTGPSAAGKSTVARLLAEHFPRGVHLEGDLFRRSIVSGRLEMTPELPPAALEQLRLRHQLAAAAADTYAAAGFTVVLEDVAAGDHLSALAELISFRPLHVVVLLPSAAAVAERDAARGHTGYADFPLDELYAGFAERTPRLGLWLDTTGQTPAETVEAILAGTLL